MLITPWVKGVRLRKRPDGITAKYAESVLRVGRNAMYDWIQKFPTRQRTEVAFKRKATTIIKSMPKKKQRKLIGDVNWERLLEDAKTQQTFLLNGSRVLRGAGMRVSSELIENLNVSYTTCINVCQHSLVAKRKGREVMTRSMNKLQMMNMLLLLVLILMNMQIPLQVQVMN